MITVSIVDPWSYATEDKRDYITPEDIQAAIDMSYLMGDDDDRVRIMKIVLVAIDQGTCEDYRLCAFVAHKMEKTEGVSISFDKENKSE